MVVDRTGHRQTREQIVERLLCGNCEQLLGNGCENYVARIAFQANGDCEIYHLLGYTSPVLDVTQRRAAAVVVCDSLETDLLVDFAISVFWRCSISTHQWTEDFALAPEVNEILRRFLLKQEASLGDIPVTLNVIDQPRGLVANRFDQIICVPGSQNLGTYQAHGFLFNGLYFSICVGAGIPPDQFDISLHHAPVKRLAFSVAANLAVLQSMSRLANTVP
jgi:hypothetical protein